MRVDAGIKARRKKQSLGAGVIAPIGANLRQDARCKSKWASRPSELAAAGGPAHDRGEDEPGQYAGSARTRIFDSDRHADRRPERGVPSIATAAI